VAGCGEECSTIINHRGLTRLLPTYHLENGGQYSMGGASCATAGRGVRPDLGQIYVGAESGGND
jgi:hypothetical protein